jgi:hypothetical protein
MQPLIRIALTSLLGTGALATACGGKAIVDGAPGSGGSGGAQAGATTSGLGAGGTIDVAASNGTTSSSSLDVGSSQVASSTVASVGTTGANTCGPAPMSCDEACATLFCCLLASGDCPAAPADGEAAFTKGCLESCVASPALIAIVDPSNCDTTVSTLIALSHEFAAYCEG